LQVKANSLIEVISDSKVWTKMDWKTFENSNVAKASDWKEYKGKADSDGKTAYLKESTAILSGIKMDLGISRRLENGNSFVVSLNSIGIDESECNKLHGWATENFGKAKVEVDAGYDFDLEVKGNVVHAINRKAQWDLGSTQIKFACFGNRHPNLEKRGEKATLIGLLSFKSKNVEEELKPLIGLQCTRSQSHSKDESIKEAEDFFLINENDMKVLDASKRPYPGEHAISKDNIEMTIVDEGITSLFLISRITGKYVVTFSNARSRKVWTGRCKKIDISKRKF